MSTEKAQWTCPLCRRKFCIPNQWHSCSKYLLNKHFSKSNSQNKILFGTLAVELQRFGVYNIIPTADGIYFQAKTNFLIIKVKEKGLKLGIMLKREKASVKQVKKIELTKNGRYCHHLAITKQEDITNQALELLEEAYKSA